MNLGIMESAASASEQCAIFAVDPCALIASKVAKSPVPKPGGPKWRSKKLSEGQEALTML